MKRYDLRLFADYCQFYLQDESAIGDLSNAWSQVAVNRLLAVAPGVVGVRTASAAVVPVSVELLDAPPTEDFESFEHVVECSLNVQSLAIVAAGCTDYLPDAQRISVVPALYRVRVCFAGLEPEAATQERYRVQCWQAPLVQPHVLKAFED